MTNVLCVKKKPPNYVFTRQRRLNGLWTVWLAASHPNPLAA
jgi:hypothetical protein